MGKIDERIIGTAAAAKLTSALRQKASSFADHVSRDPDKKSLKDAEAIARTKKYGLVKNKTQTYFLRAIVIKMEKHGFVRHYGVNSQRQAGSRTRRIPRTTTYHYRQHRMNQKAKPFLDSAIEGSGVVQYVAQKVAESRANIITEEISISLRNFK